MRREDIRGLRLGTELRTTHAKVVEEIGLSIVGGKYPVGAVLPGDQALESQFDVSRSVLREAMKTLTAKGLIVAKSRVGTRVREQCHWNLLDEDVLRWHFNVGVTPDFVEQLYDVRLLLEPAAAAAAAMRATPEDCDELRGYALQLGSEAISLQERVEADLRFHILLTLLSGNIFYDGMLGFIKSALEGALKISLSPDLAARRHNIVEAHLAIVEAVERRDPEAARATTQAVVEGGRSTALAGILAIAKG
ncbi:FadR/GntR family transcriptional regulator [Peteryoungia ipomoeae]|uniref:FadR family transcriptional regulator n=1 Tax=Peteryoungia ipomoeae TaxID=1210932 RepID=A0A4S8P4W6_9HYPH|nr:FadR/GntR family transcriptional regulator [Peteryoungia ipomoeae]THV25160.1 FadR family transcriptional regulator [Peteryoungia ipomoeae]